MRFQVLGRSHFCYFADRHFGSADAALAAAQHFAGRELALHRELLALHRRFAPRATNRSGTPGVARYEATAQRRAHWLAYYDDPASGRRKAKRFSIAIYGEAAARELAEAWRAKAIAAQIERYRWLLHLLGAPLATLHRA